MVFKQIGVKSEVHVVLEEVKALFLAVTNDHQDDYEKRIVGWWEYPGSTFEIRLEPWGALVFQEDTVKIELMKKGKLRWRGEVELISGMILNLSFEPGSDVLILEFIPPAARLRRLGRPGFIDQKALLTNRVGEVLTGNQTNMV